MGHLGLDLMMVVVVAPKVGEGASRIRVSRGNSLYQNHPECQPGESCLPMLKNSWHHKQLSPASSISSPGSPFAHPQPS